MYRKIIIGYDGTDSADDALALGREVGHATGAELVVVGVFPSGPFVDAEQQKEFAHKVQSAADLAGAEAEPFPSNSPARGLHDAVDELGAELVVVGSSSGAEIGHMSAGGVAVSMLHGSPCAVAVAPAGLHDGDVALDRHWRRPRRLPESRDAQDAAIALARATGAKLHLITVSVPAQVKRTSVGATGSSTSNASCARSTSKPWTRRPAGPRRHRGRDRAASWRHGRRTARPSRHEGRPVVPGLPRLRAGAPCAPGLDLRSHRQAGAVRHSRDPPGCQTVSADELGPGRGCAVGMTGSPTLLLGYDGSRRERHRHRSGRQPGQRAPRRGGHRLGGLLHVGSGSDRGAVA